MNDNYNDCFARVNGGCSILKQMLCKDGDCPFYKSKQQNEADKKKYPYMNYNITKRKVERNGKHITAKSKANRGKSKSGGNG